MTGLEPTPGELLGQAEDRLAEAEAAIDDYRAEVTRLMAERDRLRDGIKELLAEVTASADATRPSRKTEVEDELAIALRRLLDPE